MGNYIKVRFRLVMMLSGAIKECPCAGPFPSFFYTWYSKVCILTIPKKILCSLSFSLQFKKRRDWDAEMNQPKSRLFGISKAGKVFRLPISLLYFGGKTTGGEPFKTTSCKNKGLQKKNYKNVNLWTKGRRPRSSRRNIFSSFMGRWLGVRGGGWRKKDTLPWYDHLLNFLCSPTLSSHTRINFAHVINALAEVDDYVAGS